jgi:hypothetical protein
MAIKFKEVKEIDPWDKFADEENAQEDDVAKIAREYHEWLENQNPIVGICILCERRFKPRTEKTDGE